MEQERGLPVIEILKKLGVDEERIIAAALKHALTRDRGGEEAPLMRVLKQPGVDENRVFDIALRYFGRTVCGRRGEFELYSAVISLIKDPKIREEAEYDFECLLDRFA